MPSDAIVESLDVLDDRIFCVLSRQPGPTLDQLVLEGPEEILRDRVIPTVAAPAHAALDAASIERLAVTITRILNSAVRVMDQPFDICPMTERHGKRIETETRL